MFNTFKKKANNFFYYRTFFGEFYTKLHDINHHLKYSFREDSLKNDKDNFKYYLTKRYHILEKGLALPNPKPGFGQPKVIDLIEKAAKYQNTYGSDEMIASIKKTLSEYMIFNETKNFIFAEGFKSAVLSFIEDSALEGRGGLKNVYKESASNLNLEEYSTFVKSRASVRDFSDEEVSMSLLRSIIDIAKNSPSVCNRQGWKAHCYSDNLHIKEILSYQNGNRGFTDCIDKLIIVTADAKAFTAYESNQIFTDGGLFSMNLLLAIHAAGLGACPLNTCFPYFSEKKVKNVSNIPKSERLIMMIGVGSLKDSYKVAYSARNPTEQFFISH